MFEEFIRLQVQTTQMLIDAQTVVGWRVMGAAGLIDAADDETTRMITEKQNAFAGATLASVGALLAGETPLKAYGLALDTIEGTTGANSQRLRLANAMVSA